MYCRGGNLATKLSADGYDTDKSAQYLSNYERHFGNLRDEKITLFELGVNKGGSLLMWHDYFINGTVVGLDANPIEIETRDNRIRFYQGLQQDLELLELIGKENAPEGFDVIIDDASHIGDFTRLSFWYLFENCLKPGGVYCIEDWGTGYWDEWIDGKKFHTYKGRTYCHNFGMVGFVKELVDECGMADISREKMGSPSTQLSRFERVEVSHGQVFVIKKQYI